METDTWQCLAQSFSLVALSEMGDKTQLLAIVLGARFRKPLAVMSGILVATLFNHGLAAMLGGQIATWVSPLILKYILSATFLVFGLWLLKPDKDDGDVAANRYGAFLTTAVTFFLAEMGDKTQLATVALGARFANPFLVTIGTTLGMLVSDGAAVFLGEGFTQIVPMKYVRYAAAACFVATGLWLFLH